MLVSQTSRSSGLRVTIFLSLLLSCSIWAINLSSSGVAKNPVSSSIFSESKASLLNKLKFEKLLLLWKNWILQLTIAYLFPVSCAYSRFCRVGSSRFPWDPPARRVCMSFSRTPLVEGAACARLLRQSIGALEYEKKFSGIIMIKLVLNNRNS